MMVSLLTPFCCSVLRRALPIGGLRSRTAAAFLLLLSTATFAAAPRAPRPNEPVLSFPLDTLGFTPLPARFLIAGAATFTLHFVDNTHLLLTFHSRGLLPRLADSTPADDDRNVTAELIELPSGKILARTTWRTRDQEQYLWPLSHGRFLLRIRNKLTVFQPLQDLASDTPFRQQPFLELKRRIAYIAASPGGDLLVVETAPPRPIRTDTTTVTPPAAPAQPQGQPGTSPQLKRRPSGPDPATTSARPATQTAATAPKPPQLIDIESEPPGRPPVDLHFFRLVAESKPGEPDRLLATSAGVLSAHNLVNVPITAEGFLDILKESDRVYNFDFQSHSGKRLELSAYDTTCAPRPYFVSRTDFIAFGCHGAPDKSQLSAFNLRGEEPWLTVYSGQYISPSLATAPDAGRFALSRILLSSAGYFDADNIQPDELTGQEIAVMQTHDGRTLLKVQASPIQRTGQNFDISPDGLSFTVIRGGNLEVYHLPPLTAADQKQLQLAAASLPEKNSASIQLMSKKIAAPSAAEDASKALTVPSAPAADMAAPTPSAPAAAENTVGDAPPDAPRKPPTLYDPEHPKPAGPP